MISTRPRRASRCVAASALVTLVATSHFRANRSRPELPPFPAAGGRNHRPRRIGSNRRDPAEKTWVAGNHLRFQSNAYPKSSMSRRHTSATKSRIRGLK
jgi:hypothetical protein